MKKHRGPGQARAPSWSDTFTQRDRRLAQVAVGIAVALAAVVIPGFSLYVAETHDRVERVLASAEFEAQREGSANDREASTPQQLRGTVDQTLSPGEQQRFAARLGFGKHLTPAQKRQRLNRYAQALSQRNYDAIPQNVKQMAVKKFGKERLRKLKKQFEKLGLSHEQMILYGMRELGRQ